MASGSFSSQSVQEVSAAHPAIRSSAPRKSDFILLQYLMINILLFCYYVFKRYAVLDVKLNSEVITSYRWVSTAATTPSVVTLTVVRHLRNQEEVITVQVELQA